MLLVQFNKRRAETLSKGSWLGGVTLFVYAITFSYAYITLDTATGALILFGAVQLSILLIAYFRGQKFGILKWSGIAIAFSGVINLVWPLLSKPSIFGAILMFTAGVAWGIYTLIGRESSNPLADTGYNFLRTLPFVSLLCLFTFSHFQLSTHGVLFAIVSGALTSGIGYAIWYLVLPHLTTTQAGALQLTIPIIAAIGGVVFVAEPMTLRLVLSSCLVLGGIGLVIFGKKS
jgi:drug/metabolite transporter (DMT)-like permease